MDNLSGLMEEAIKDNGKMENKMEEESSRIEVEFKKQGYGAMTKS